MKFTHFANTSELLQFLQSSQANIIKYKLNKSDYIKLKPNYNKNIANLPTLQHFNQTTYNLLFLEGNEICLDCDNLYTYNTLKLLFTTYNTSTLCTKSQFGGHIYFKSRLVLKSIQDLTKPPIKQESDLIYYQKAESFNVEVFKNNVKPIFDGAQNPYYKIDSVTQTLANIDDNIDLTESLIEFFGTNPQSLKISMIGNKLFKPSLAKYKSVKNWLQQGNIDIFEFKSWYENDIRTFDTKLAEGRNIFLQSVLGCFGSCGYFESFSELQGFIKLVNLQLLPEPLSEYELNNTILHKNKANHYSYNTETLEYLKQNTEAITILNGSDFYIARNYLPNNNNQLYLLIDLRKNCLHIRYIANRKLLNNIIRANKNLQTIDFATDDLLPVLHYEFNYNNNTLYYRNDDDVITLNIAFFIYNKSIYTTLKQFQRPSDIVKAEFEATSFNQVLTHNLIPNEYYRAKFLGDLANYLKNRSFLYNMLIIRDLEGDTGKDSILTTYLKTLIFNTNTTDFTTQSINDKTTLIKTDTNTFAISLSAKEFLHSAFNGSTLEHKLIVFNEDGGEINQIQFMKKLQSFIKTATITIEKKGENRTQIPNRIFILRYTNTKEDLVSNTEAKSRFYISEAQKVLDLKDINTWQRLFKDFTPEAVNKQALQEMPIILEYLLHYAEQEDLYKEIGGYTSNPMECFGNDIDSMDIDDEFESTSDFLYAITDQSADLRARVFLLLETLIHPNTRTFNIKILLDLFHNHKSHLIFPIACILLYTFGKSGSTFIEYEGIKADLRSIKEEFRILTNLNINKASNVTTLVKCITKTVTNSVGKLESDLHKDIIAYILQRVVTIKNKTKQTLSTLQYRGKSVNQYKVNDNNKETENELQEN